MERDLGVRSPGVGNPARAFSFPHLPRPSDLLQLLTTAKRTPLVVFHTNRATDMSSFVQTLEYRRRACQHSRKRLVAFQPTATCSRNYLGILVGSNNRQLKTMWYEEAS
jgi:hypothetical protein